MAHIFSTPLDIEPLPAEGTVLVSDTSAPPPHAITLDRLTSEHDFEDSAEGRCNLAALNRFKALLQRGFNTSDNLESGVPRGTWLVIVTELLVVIHKSIRASHGSNPSPRAFTNLDSDELGLFGLIAKTCDTLFDFFDGYKTNYKEWTTCLRCVEQCRLPIDEAKYTSVAMTCGQSIAAIHSTVVNEKTREIHQRVHEWGEKLYATITNAFTEQIVAEEGDASFLTLDDPRLVNWLNITANNLREHARAKLLDETVDRYVVPWASERMDAATGSILATDNDRIRDLRAEAEKRANADASNFYHELLPTLKAEAQARAKADAYASFAEDQARFRAEADAELASFKHSLKIETADRKAKAQEAADKSVSLLARSSAKANKGKARHDPMGKRSRAPSVSSSRPSSPVLSSPLPLSDAVLPLPTTPEAQVVALMEPAPVDTTPKASAFHAAAVAMEPVITLLNERDRAKADQTWEAMSSTLTANTEKQLAAFGTAFSKQMVDALTKQMSSIIAPLTDRIAAIERDYAALEQLDADACAYSWGLEREGEVVPTSDPNEADYDMQEIPGSDPNYKRTPHVPGAKDPIPPFIEDIFRRIQQIPDGVPITHHKVLHELAEMNSWFHNSFVSSYDVELDLRANFLPTLIEDDLVRDYKEWYESGAKVPAAPSRGPVPARPHAVKAEGNNRAKRKAESAQRPMTAVVGPLTAPLVGGNPPRPSGSSGAPPPARVPSHLPIASLQEFPPMVSDWSMPDGHQSGVGLEPAKNTIDFDAIPSEEEANWLRPSGRQNHRRSQPPKPTSFAAAAASPIPRPAAFSAPLGPTSTTNELTKADLDKLPKADLIRTFNMRFNGGMATKTQLSKDAIVASYLAKINAPAPKPRAPMPTPNAGTKLSTTQYTVVRNPTTAGLAKVTSKTHESSVVVRTLQRALRQHFPSGVKVPVDLIGGRWGAQSSSNFVLIFNGTPGSVAVMQCRSVFYEFFGSDCVIVPQKGYSRVLLKLVPICRSDSGSLPSGDALAEELRRNAVFRDLTMFCPPRWLKANVPENAIHSSVIVTFLDEDGSRTRDMIRFPQYMFGGCVRAVKFNALPLLLQCDRCWRLGHASRRCPKPKTLVMCSICGGAHKASDHQFKCSGSLTHSSLKCNCIRKCLNCTREKPAFAEGHLATDTTCPLRAKFKTTDNRSGDTTDEDARAATPMEDDTHPDELQATL